MSTTQLTLDDILRMIVQFGEEGVQRMHDQQNQEDSHLFAGVHHDSG